MQEKYGFVYIWYDRKHKRFYIGSHWGTETDNYVCSSLWMKRSQKRRPQDFKRRVLQYVYDREVITIEEHKWLDLIKDEELGKKYYNLSKHKPGHWSTDPNARLTIGQKLSKSKIGNQNRKGKQFTEDAKKRISETLKETLSSPEERQRLSLQGVGRKNHSVPHSEETKTRMSENAPAKTYTFLSPDGELITFTNMHKFCRDNNLNRGNMSSVASGRVKQCKGWTIPSNQ